VGPQRLEDLPHRGVPLVVGQGLLGRHPGRDADGQDDVAELLARGLAHDAADGLDDVDHRLAGGQEQHRV
jgi:hypothetical protein